VQALAAAREALYRKADENVPAGTSTTEGMLEGSRPAVEALGGGPLLAKPCTAEELATAIARGLADR